MDYRTGSHETRPAAKTRGGTKDHAILIVTSRVETYDFWTGSS